MVVMEKRKRHMTQKNSQMAAVSHSLSVMTLHVYRLQLPLTTWDKQMDKGE